MSIIEGGDALQRLYYQLQDDLDRIAKRFKAPKVTLIVRNPALADGDVVLSDDDLEAAIEALRRLQRERAVKAGGA